jgi:hypothetical protein
MLEIDEEEGVLTAGRGAAPADIADARPVEPREPALEEESPPVDSPAPDSPEPEVLRAELISDSACWLCCFWFT